MTSHAALSSILHGTQLLSDQEKRSCLPIIPASLRADFHCNYLSPYLSQSQQNWPILAILSTSRKGMGSRVSGRRERYIPQKNNDAVIYKKHQLRTGTNKRCPLHHYPGMQQVNHGTTCLFLQKGVAVTSGTGKYPLTSAPTIHPVLAFPKC